MLLGSKIKNKIADKNIVNDLDKADAKKIKKQKDALKRLETVIAKIKENLELMSSDKMNIDINNSGNVFITDTRKIFGHDCYESDTYSNLRGNINFFKFYEKCKFNKTINDFKIWLSENEIESIIIGWNHCGAGISSWNTYHAKLIK